MNDLKYCDMCDRKSCEDNRMQNIMLHATVAKTRRRVSSTMARPQKRRAIGAADGHPLSVRRFAPAIQRMERTAVAASKLTPPSAAHPQPRWMQESIHAEGG